VAVVAALRAAGMSVVSLAAVGNGCPDLVVGWRGRNVLLEIKDGSKPPSARKLTPDEAKFHNEWMGYVVIAESPLEAVQKVMRYCNL
jgi:Holliday junction resolvase